VDGDPVRLSQVLTNLLDNAARYSPEGSKIDLTVSVSGPYVLIRVRDQGAGIERDLMPRVFELFVQGSKPPLAGEGGLGIGLPLARRLAEMHGGTLTAYSTGAGKGSEFTLQLPILAVSDLEKPDARGSAPARLTRQRVLIIEDNRDTATMMNLMLTEWGQDTRIAHDGATALEMAKEFKPEVVLLDVGLPKLHGYEVARRLRQQEWARDTFVIAITGWGLEADRHAEAAGIDHRLLKPVDPAALHGLLANRVRSQNANPRGHGT
jgi:CheY-like chemotaxis protein